MTEIPILTWPPRVTRYYCPINCGWYHDAPGPKVAIDSDPLALTAAHMKAIDDAVRAHLESHSLEEWTTEIDRLRAQVPPPAPDLTAVPWRAGDSDGRSVYAVSGHGLEEHHQPVGRFDSRELAADAVAAHNAELIRRQVLASVAADAGRDLAALPWRPRGLFVEAVSDDPSLPDVGVMAGEVIAAYVAVAHNDLLIQAHLARRPAKGPRA